MDKLVVSALFFPILMGITFFQYRKELIFLAKNKLIDDGASVDLVIVVPSAREHVSERSAIRDTWWSGVRDNVSLSHRVSLKFVVGAFGCPYPPEGRLSEHGCEEWAPSTVQEGDILAVTDEAGPHSSPYTREYGIQYLPFQVDHPVLLERLGLLQACLVDGAVVRLVDAVSQKTIVSASFDVESPGDSERGFYYKPVETYLLPKGFEGIIIGENTGSHDGKMPLRSGTNHGFLQNSSAIRFIQFPEPVYGHYADPFAWEANHYTTISFQYKIQDMSALKSIIDGRHDRISQRRRKNLEIDNVLQEEMEQYEDILLVDVLDTYRNIPLKLLKAYQRLTELSYFRYFLKTDDDSYLDVARIMAVLDEMKNRQGHHSESLWWGRFRHNWPVEHYGKWAERSYPGSVYPRFACGAGYVLSNSLVRWVADNGDNLNVYQGEDTSIGIWLAGVLPHYLDDPLWQCESECISDMYAMPDLTPERLRQLWTYKTQCGDPCGCR